MFIFYILQNGQSMLRLSEDPGAYLEWYKERKQEQEEERRLEMIRRQEKELEGCTFVPQTTECPAYVKR